MGRSVVKSNKGFASSGVGPEDQEDLDYAVRKLVICGFFSDTEGKMNLSVKDIQGEILSIFNSMQIPKRESSSLYRCSQTRYG